MKAVNLLPAKHRPRQTTGGKQGSSFVLLGALAAVAVALLVYVLSLNSINSAKSDIADAQAETTRANAQAEALGAYGNFAQVKAERVAAVKSLAQQRVDWERVVRELAHVLPAGVWIQSADASESPAADSSGSAASAPAAGAKPSTGPEITLKGCANTQPQVAEAIVRLRQLEGAEDVSLDHSTQPTDVNSSASSDSGDCGLTNGRANYDFEVTVTLKGPSTTSDRSGQVPASLGGGQ